MMPSTARRFTLLVAAAAVMALFALLIPPGQARAEGPVSLQLQAPEEGRLGETSSVVAVLRDGRGAPVPGATVVLWSPATFLSTDGDMRLGQAVTDAQGQATFSYEPRGVGTVTLKASFAGDSKSAAAQASAEVAILPGGGPLYEETAGIRVPGVGVWMLIAVLGGVWAVYFTVMGLLALIAREGPKPA